MPGIFEDMIDALKANTASNTRLADVMSKGGTGGGTGSGTGGGGRPAAPPLTTIQEKAKELAKAKGKAVALGLLKDDFGVAGTAELKKSDYNRFLKAADALIAAEEDDNTGDDDDI